LRTAGQELAAALDRYDRWAAIRKRRQAEDSDVALEPSPTKVRNLCNLIRRLLDHDTGNEWDSRHFLTRAEQEWLEAVKRRKPYVGDYHEAQQIESKVIERRRRKWNEAAK
jgi:hypothetical protein